MLSEVSGVVFLVYAVGIFLIVEKRALGLGHSILVGLALGTSLHFFKWVEKLYFVSNSKYDETSMAWLAFWVFVGVSVTVGPYVKRRFFSF